MRLSLKISLIALTTAITGCQTYIPKTQPQTARPQATNQFDLQGKIGVKTPQQSGSAFFTWQQNQDQFDIELTGALGIGRTHIQGTHEKVTLTSAKTGTITAQTPEELLEKATGWQTPITHLVSWVQAKPATTQAHIQYDAEKRPIQIIEDGWTVQLNYNETTPLPNKLILTQNQENRITMVIQNR